MHSSKPLKSLLPPQQSPTKYPPLSSYYFENGRFKNTFEDVQEIGQGGFGRVVKATHKLDRGVYAVKIVKIEASAHTLLKETLGRALREVSAMVNRNHPGIVRYMTCWLERSTDKELLGETMTSVSGTEESKAQEMFPKSKSAFKFEKASQQEKSEEMFSESNSAFEFEKASQQEKSEEMFSKSNSAFAFEKTSQQKSLKESKTCPDEENSEDLDEGTICLFIQLEFCNGLTLKDFIESKTASTIAKKLEVFLKILGGVNVFHSVGIIHRDLKPANVFIDIDGNVKIGDFGLAIHRFENNQFQKDSGSQIDSDDLTKGVGTTRYMSPEMKDPLANYDIKTDIYALGIIFYEMLVNFGSEMERNIVLDNLTKNGKFPDEFLKNFNEESKIISRMIHPIPTNRPDGNVLVQEISQRKSHYESQKYKEGVAEVIGYDGKRCDPPAKISSLLVENSQQGIFTIMQGLKGELLTRPPGIGRKVAFKYLENDRKGRPANPIFLGVL